MRRLYVSLVVLCLVSFLCSACSSSKSSSPDPGPTGAAPVADFSGTPTSGPAPLDVQFTSLCTGIIDSYSWDFGDGGTSTVASPFHTYDTDGTYTVVLTVIGPGGSDTEIKSAYITVGGGGPAGLDANFIASPTSGVKPLDVQFTDTSTPAASILTWSWDFGDGSSSTEQHPLYQYTTAGTYTVSLTVGDGTTTDNETKTGYITVNDTPVGTDDWETLTSGTSQDIYGISFASTTVGWAVGTNDTLLYTSNGGNSWTDQFGNIGGLVRYTKESSAHILGSKTPNPGQSNLMDVHATSTTTAWVSSYGPCHNLDLTPCFVTTDGGAGWTCVITATNFQERGIYAFDGNTARICTVGDPVHHPDSDIQIIEGGYDTDSYPISWGCLFAIGFGDSSTGWTGGDDFYKSTNGGTSWSEISKPSGTGRILDISAISATTAWACSTGGKIIKTEDGSTWNSQTSGVSGDLWGINFIDANNGWCVGAGGTILVTTNGGTTWTPTDSGTTSTLTDVSAVDATHVWACGASGIILRSK